MDPEKKMWQDLRDHIGHAWDACRHENQFGEGMPDVSFGARGVNGWLELKCLLSWPVRHNTVVHPHKFTGQQKVWLWRRGEHGGHTWLLFKVENTWMLFDHNRAQGVGRDLTKTGLWKVCNYWWTGIPPIEEFLKALTK